MRFPSLRRRKKKQPPVASPASVPMAEPIPVPMAEPIPVPMAEPLPVPTAEPIPVPVVSPAPVLAPPLPEAPPPAPAPEYPAYPVHPSRYREAHRPQDPSVQYVVLHVSGTAHSDLITELAQPGAPSGVHYAVSRSGDVAGLIPESHYALHTNHVMVNQQSIGIDHEAVVDDATSFSPDLYTASAELVRSICRRYAIPIDRKHILGNHDVPESSAVDPGLYWDWDRYMALLREDQELVIDNSSSLRFWAGNSWSTSRWHPQRQGEDYRYALPSARPDAAWFRIPFAKSGRYRIFLWYPSGPGYNSAVPVTLHTADGQHTLHVDQRSGGGRWMPLGTFPFQAGDYWAVSVGRKTNTGGYIVVDAIKVVPVLCG